MDGAVIGIFTASTAVFAMLLYLLLVRPEITLSLFSDDPATREGWVEHHPGAVRGFRFALGLLLVTSSFLMGLSLAFLTGTG